MFTKYSARAFSLVELMISLIVISCITAAFAPVVTKKLKSSNVSVSMSQGSTSEITTECAESFSDSCKLCTSTYCIQCELSSCASGTYTDSRTCSCKNCSDIFSNCIECDSEKCTKCKDNNYYINNGKCESCPTNKICDGINAYDQSYCSSPPAGYFCDGSTIRKCEDKYDIRCGVCNSSRCISCAAGYYLSGTSCKGCIAGCSECSNATTCKYCYLGFYVESVSNTCAPCKNLDTNCVQCSNAPACTGCKAGYYLTSSNSCQSCSSISNCLTCNSNGQCTKCNNGYYVNSSKTCSNCTVSNCAQCNTDGTCLSCNQGYHLSENKSVCESNESKFSCSDSNFMQIGNLCVTRKNMGDSSILRIPSSVYAVEAGSEYCSSKSSKCCWRGTTTNLCTSSGTVYSGCTRTLCNWDAANDICSKFNYGEKIWRLPTKEEMANWWVYTLALSSQGLLLCDGDGVYNSAWCGATYGICLGSYDSACYPQYVWISEKSGTGALAYMLASGVWYGPWGFPLSEAFSVRCVTEME